MTSTFLIDNGKHLESIGRSNLTRSVVNRLSKIAKRTLHAALTNITEQSTNTQSPFFFVRYATQTAVADDLCSSVARAINSLKNDHCAIAVIISQCSFQTRNALRSALPHFANRIDEPTFQNVGNESEILIEYSSSTPRQTPTDPLARPPSPGERSRFYERFANTSSDSDSEIPLSPRL
jgi:hypothetical protein